MNRRTPVFVLEALNAVSTAFYFNYLFFFLKAEFGFSSFQNLLVCALNGFVFMCSAIYGGRYGQKHGYVNAVILGCVIMTASLVAGAYCRTVTGLMLTMVLWTIGMCFTWPNLEALTCDKQKPADLPRIIGVYNVIWSGGGAIAYFFGGAVAETLGWRSIFWLPALINIFQIGLAIWYLPRWKVLYSAPSAASGHLDEHHPQGAKFLKMAWIANPFAYVAINAVIPLIPDVANRLELSPKFAGFFCSIWFFARTATFAILAVWDGWHYRFNHLVIAYIGTVLSFALMLWLESLAAIVLIQLAFGWCIGLIYYSSLYYSMHVGETKGEHGGFHEAAIGAGIFAGPAIGAASLYLSPAHPHSSIVGVAIALSGGFIALLRVKAR